MIYKSIFDKLKDYKSNPIDEFNKIRDYVENLCLYYDVKLFSYLRVAYKYCDEFRSVFPELDDLLDSNCSTISNIQSHGKKYDEYFNDIQKESLLDEYLTYCQVLLILIFAFKSNKQEITGYLMDIDTDNSETDYCLSLISNSLKSFGYKYVKSSDSCNVEIISDNPIGESVAAMSSNTISDVIYSYLGTRDVKAKETYLHNFIDLIEPLIKKYSEQSMVKKIRQYVQLVRHPETKKEQKEYRWYFSDKKQYLDDLFMMCLFIQQYDISNNIVCEFDRKKTTQPEE